MLVADDEYGLAEEDVRRPTGDMRARGLVAWRLTGRRAGLALFVAGGAVLCVVVRFWARSPLWLDEAQSVAIARRPVTQIPRYLRHDGSPPLYYVLLHYWMRVFGRTRIAVRSLSGVTSVAAVPVMAAAGRRLAGRWGAAVAAVLLLTSPFAVRYATETRMYSLVILLVLVWVLCVDSVIRQPRGRSVAALAVVTAALLYTHYWSLFLAAAAVAVAVTVRPLAGRTRLALVGGVAAGVAAFVPWVPTLRWQTVHTATPWDPRPDLRDVLAALGGFTDGFRAARTPLAVVFAVLVVAGLRQAWRSPRMLVASGSPSKPPASACKVVAWILVVTLALAFGASAVTGTALTFRYLAVVVPLYLLVATFGIARWQRRAHGPVLLGTTALIGLGISCTYIRYSRTQAGEVSAAIIKTVQSGDVVVYCPDQLGPDVSRLLPAWLQQVTFPRSAAPDRVDWVDYRRAIAASSPVAFVAGVTAEAGPHAIWLVWAHGHYGVDPACEGVSVALDATGRSATDVVVPDDDFFEREGVRRYSGSPQPSLVASAKP